MEAKLPILATIGDLLDYIETHNLPRALPICIGTSSHRNPLDNLEETPIYVERHGHDHLIFMSANTDEHLLTIDGNAANMWNEDSGEPVTSTLYLDATVTINSGHIFEHCTKCGMVLPVVGPTDDNDCVHETQSIGALYIEDLNKHSKLTVNIA